MWHGNSVVDLFASTESCTLSISNERTDYIAVFCTFGSTVKTGSGISRQTFLSAHSPHGQNLWGQSILGIPDSDSNFEKIRIYVRGVQSTGVRTADGSSREFHRNGCDHQFMNWWPLSKYRFVSSLQWHQSTEVWWG